MNNITTADMKQAQMKKVVHAKRVLDSMIATLCALEEEEGSMCDITDQITSIHRASKDMQGSIDRAESILDNLNNFDIRDMA
jgi:hypothetical protein